MINANLFELRPISGTSMEKRANQTHIQNIVCLFSTILCQSAEIHLSMIPTCWAQRALAPDSKRNLASWGRWLRYSYKLSGSGLCYSRDSVFRLHPKGLYYLSRLEFAQPYAGEAIIGMTDMPISINGTQDQVTCQLPFVCCHGIQGFSLVSIGARCGPVHHAPNARVIVSL